MRKHLGFTIGEWEALPWWQQQVYLEGLTEELSGGQQQQTGQRQSGGQQRDPDDLSRFGMNVVKADFG